MDLNLHGDHAQDRVIASTSWMDEGGMLSPTSGATMDSERLSLTSPNQRVVNRRLTDPEGGRPGSRASVRSIASRGNISETGISTTGSEKANHGPVLRPTVAVGEFKEFIGACQKLEQYLESFTHQVQKLGSAFGLVKASRELHVNLTKARQYFEENAQTLGLLINKIKAAKSPKQAKKRKKRRVAVFAHSDTASSISESSQGVNELNTLAASVNTFTTAIVDFEDYSDEKGLECLQEFEIELRVLSGGLEFFSADGESNELRRFVTARASSLKVHLDNLSEALKRFEEIGIPCISFAQKRSSRMLLNAATVATFFAGVAATTLQYSVEIPSSERKVAINTLWFVSLVLSIGAAITGMLAMTWRLAVFSSPKRQLPWYIRFWIRSGYLALLIASVIAFLAGLVVFVFDTMPMTSFWIVTACTVFCSLGLTVVSVLFLKERYSFTRVRDELRKGLNPVDWSRIYEHADEGWWYWIRFHLIEQLQQKRRTLVAQYRYHAEDEDHEKMSPGMRIKVFLRFCFPWYRLKARRRATRDDEADLEGVIGELKGPAPWTRSSKKTASAVQRSNHDRPHRHGPQHQYSSGDETLNQWYKSQLHHLGLSLSAPVDARAVHLQFSPHGHWLVVCYKYECCVFEVERNFEYHTTLRHRHNAKQVEWCPNGRRLITRTSSSVKLWSKDDRGRFSYEQTVYFDYYEVSDIQWLNSTEFLAIVNESQFFRVDISDSPATKTKYDPASDNPLLEIYYLYTLPDSELVMIVGAQKIEDVDEEKAIDCIIAYEMQAVDTDSQSQSSVHTWGTVRDYNRGRGVIVRRIPLLYELESLCFGPYLNVEARQRRMVISYTDKPPELWTVTLDGPARRIDMSLERELVKRMDPGEKQEEDAEWGEVFLIGPSQNIAACAEDGMMYFWDVEQTSNEQFHRLQIVTDEEEVEELPLITWLGTHGDSILPMMATAGKGLSLKIWASLGSTTMDDNHVHNEVHGPMDDCLAQVARPESTGPQLIAPSDSGLGQVLPIVHTPPHHTFALPKADMLEARRGAKTPSSPAGNLDLPYRSSPTARNAPLAPDDTEYAEEKSSHLAAGSQYCTSPESSVKEIVDQEEADGDER